MHNATLICSQLSHVAYAQPCRNCCFSLFEKQEKIWCKAIEERRQQQQSYLFTIWGLNVLILINFTDQGHCIGQWYSCVEFLVPRATVHSSGLFHLEWNILFVIDAEKIIQDFNEDSLESAMWQRVNNLNKYNIYQLFNMC